MKNVFTDPDERAADQLRRETLRAQRDALGLTNAALAAELSRLSDETHVDYWTVRSWLASQDAKRARGCPLWTIQKLGKAHKLQDDARTRVTDAHARKNISQNNI